MRNYRITHIGFFRGQPIWLEIHLYGAICQWHTYTGCRAKSVRARKKCIHRQISA